MNLIHIPLGWLVTLMICIVTIAIQVSTVQASSDSESTSPIEVREAKLERASLPANVVPIKYRITLKLEIEEGLSLLKGKVKIFFKVAEPSLMGKLGSLLADACLENPVGSEIVFHLDNRYEILGVDLRGSNTRQDHKYKIINEWPIKDIRRDYEKQMVSVRLGTRLFHGSHGELTIRYRPIRDQNIPLDTGTLVLGKIQDENPLSQVMANLQSGRARELLPCLDEPHFKSEIQLIIKLYSKTEIVSNAPGKSNLALDKQGVPYLRKEFQPTQPMSINGLTFAIGSFHKELAWEGKVVSGPERLTISVTVPRQYQQNWGQFALDFAKRCFELSRQPRWNFPLPNKDLRLVGVASPSDWDILTGAGMALIDHKLLLLDPSSEVSQEQKIEAGLSIALVVARQWFGNLITPQSWSDLWITEALAGYMALKMVNELEPDWMVFKYVRGKHLKRALELDSTGACPPISHFSNNQNPTGSEFSMADFELVRLIKGAALIQTLERYVATPLATIVRPLLLDGHSTDNKAIDLPKLAKVFASASSKKDRKIDDIVMLIRPWIEFSGYPQLHVSLIDKDQKRGAILIEQTPTTRLNGRLEQVQDVSIWRAPLAIGFYNREKAQDQNGMITMLDSVNTNTKTAARPNNKSSMSLDLPAWLQTAAANIELIDHHETLLYYGVSCSEKIKC